MSDSLTFDRAAHFYDETRGFPPGVAEQAAALIAAVGRLDTSQTVLEVGVGTGRIALPLAAHVRGVAGLDLSRPMMARLLDKRQGERVLPVEGDAVHLPFAAGRFPAAVAVHVFHLIPAWRDAVAELARVLGPDGVLLSAWTEGDDAFEPLWAAWRAAIPVNEAERVGVRFGEREGFLDSLGWRPVEARQFTYTAEYSPALILDWLARRVWSRTWRLSDAELAAGVAAFRAAAEDRFGDLDRPVPTAIAFKVRAARPPQP